MRGSSRSSLDGLRLAGPGKRGVRAETRGVRRFGAASSFVVVARGGGVVRSRDHVSRPHRVSLVAGRTSLEGLRARPERRSARRARSSRSSDRRRRGMRVFSSSARLVVGGAPGGVVVDDEDDDDRRVRAPPRGTRVAPIVGPPLSPSRVRVVRPTFGSRGIVDRPPINSPAPALVRRSFAHPRGLLRQRTTVAGLPLRETRATKPVDLRDAVADPAVAACGRGGGRGLGVSSRGIGAPSFMTVLYVQ